MSYQEVKDLVALLSDISCSVMMFVIVYLLITRKHFFQKPVKEVSP